MKMKSIAETLNSRPAAYLALVAGWLTLAGSDKAPEAWRIPLLGLGWLLFIWAWLKVSPCAAGACKIPEK